MQYKLRPGPWFNIKTSYKYRKSHCRDKTVVRSSYLHNGISHTGKMSLYWISPNDIITTCLKTSGTGGFPIKTPLMRSFQVVFVASLDRKLNKYPSCRWLMSGNASTFVFQKFPYSFHQTLVEKRNKQCEYHIVLAGITEGLLMWMKTSRTIFVP